MILQNFKSEILLENPHQPEDCYEKKKKSMLMDVCILMHLCQPEDCYKMYSIQCKWMLKAFTECAKFELFNCEICIYSVPHVIFMICIVRIDYVSKKTSTWYSAIYNPGFM